MPTDKLHSIFVIQPYNEIADAVFRLIVAAAGIAGAQVVRADQLENAGQTTDEKIQSAVQNSSLVIADVSDGNPNVMYEFGLAKALEKPLLVISRGVRSIPISVAHAHLVLAYDLAEPTNQFVSRLARSLSEILAHPAKFTPQKSREELAKRHKIFISYSHSDRDYLDRLLIHLKPLEKEGTLDLWVDTQLKAGDKWKKEIEKALSISNAAILLVSADFLASDFIANNELPPLLRSAEEKGTRIIPIVVKPCRFVRDKNLKHFQAINDPKTPLVLMSPGEQEVVYDSVAEEVERWLEAG